MVVLSQASFKNQYSFRKTKALFLIAYGHSPSATLVIFPQVVIFFVLIKSKLNCITIKANSLYKSFYIKKRTKTCIFKRLLPLSNKNEVMRVLRVDRIVGIQS
jgi:hypothetical protein